MNRHTSIILALVCLPFWGFSQNVGLGIATPPTRARFEVHGISGAGRTSGIFGGDLGISLQRSIPAIGFNQYRDDSLDTNNGRYLGSGYAAVFSYTHNDATLVKGIELNIYPPGSANALVPAGIRPIHLSSNGRLNIMTDGNAVLDVGRGTGGEGTAWFQGTNYQTHFNYSTGENTYIRPGKSSHVYLNDITGGKVVFGDGAARIGVNTASPVYTLEVRQVAGTGLRMANAPYPTQTWEWRVSGSPSNFYAYHSGAIKTHIRPSDGALNPVSDGRLKTNVRALAPLLERLLKLRPVSYEMIQDNPTHIRSTGFVAQEVAALFPQLTLAGNTNDDMMSLQYNGFGVLAIKGIQEEQQHIVQLEQTLNAAEKRLVQIEQKLAAMKARQ